MSRWLLGISIAVLGLGAPELHAERSFSNASVASGTAVETPHNKGTSQEMAAEGASLGVDNAVVAAQQEVRDPFVTVLDATESTNISVAAVQPATIKVELQGIGLGGKNAYAIIGGEVFFSGDEKNGIKLVEVRRQEVDIIVNGKPMTCPLFSDQELGGAKGDEGRK